MKPSRLPSPAGFTLVEVLTAVCIFGVLAVLLFGAGSTFTRRAKGVQCLSNLRELGMVFHAYAGENNGAIPAAQNNYLNTQYPSVSWMTVIQNYTDMNFPKVGEKNVLLCPSAVETFPNHVARRGYGLNAAGTDSKTPIKILNVGKPSQTLLLADTRDNGTGQGDGVSTFGANNYAASVEWRHRGNLNILFFDGHIESLSAKDSASLDTFVRNLIP